MLETLKRLLSPEYLVVAEPGPLGGLWVLYVALGLLFAAGLALAVWTLAGPGRASRPRRQNGPGPGSSCGSAWPGWAPSSGASWAGRAGRRASGPTRWRRWPLPERWPTASGVGRCLPGWPTSLASWPLRHTPAQQPASGASRGVLLVGLLAHLVGIGLVLVARYGWPWWTAPLVLAVLLLPQAPLWLDGARLGSWPSPLCWPPTG